MRFFRDLQTESESCMFSKININYLYIPNMDIEQGETASKEACRYRKRQRRERVLIGIYIFPGGKFPFEEKRKEICMCVRKNAEINTFMLLDTLLYTEEANNAYFLRF